MIYLVNQCKFIEFIEKIIEKFYKFTEKVFEELKYCKKNMKKHFKKELVMTKKIQAVDKYLLCNKLYHQKDAGVGDHCHAAGK